MGVGNVVITAFIDAPHPLCPKCLNEMNIALYDDMHFLLVHPKYDNSTCEDAGTSVPVVKQRFVVMI